MATRKRFLVYATAALLLLGVAFTAYPLLKSLSPSAKAQANVRTFSAASVPVGGLRVVREGEFATIVVQPKPGEFLIFETSYMGSSFRDQPDVYMIFPGAIECYDFEATKVTIRCLGPHRPTLEWTFDGHITKEIHEQTHWFPEIEMLQYSILGDTVRYGPGA